LVLSEVLAMLEALVMWRTLALSGASAKWEASVKWRTVVLWVGQEWSNLVLEWLVEGSDQVETELQVVEKVNTMVEMVARGVLMPAEMVANLLLLRCQ
jgi:hypothetical protein